MKKTLNKARPVLIFNRRKLLTLFSTSVNEAAKALKILPGNISKACLGDCIACGMYYFRYIDDDIEIELSDFGTLTLEEYDKLCGVNRAIYPTMSMNKKKRIKNFKYEEENED